MAESSKPTITEFLLARISEDEAVATAERDDTEGWGNPYSTGAAINFENRFDPARVLAECKAKLAIIAAGITAWSDGTVTETGCDVAYGEGQYCTTYDAALRALASVYADHPDYDPEWAA